ncbi:hypothetical protein DS67_00600 [Mesotoga sp. SC_4PWA21]|nr:hypothetical protein DS67_00600 [Mesotoga sp. SC_4PWA21]
MIKTLLGKALDLLLKKSSLYRIAFKTDSDTRSIQGKNFEKLSSISFCKSHHERGPSSDDRLLSAFTVSSLDVAQSDRYFWKASWKGFDPKDFWEVARGWQWLRAFLVSENENEKNQVIEKIIRWLEQNPYPNGLAWAVGLDVAIRAVNLALILSMTDNQSLKDHLSWHYQYLRKMLWLSKNSVRNNHYLGELTVLAILSKMFGGKDHLRLKQRVENEIKRQFYADGVNVEQSVRYHKFSLEFAVLAKLFLGVDTPLLERAGVFLAAVKKPDGSWPSIGDDDLGCVLRLHEDGLNGDYKAILSILALLYGRQDFKKAAEEMSAEANLLVKDAPSRWATLKELEPKKSYLFDKGGFFIHRTGWERSDSYFLVKFGPHKWHAHADLFHIELSINGKNILIDSGTYRYNNVPEQRRYFRSTPAHNTISAKDLDQTKQWTTFRWHRPAKVTEWNLVENSKGFEFKATHNGYRRIGLYHSRRISGSSDLKALIISDSVQGKGTGKVKLFWHFSPEVSLSKTGENEFTILNSEGSLGSLKLHTEESLTTQIIDTPFSERYGSLLKKKTLEITVQKRPKNEITIETEFQFK